MTIVNPTASFVETSQSCPFITRVDCPIMQIAVTQKVIPHMQCAFQAASQQLDTRLLWNSLHSKIEGSYFDSWPLLDFFKMWDVLGFRSAGHIILLFDFCLPYIQENPEVAAENVLLPPRMLQQWTATFCTSMHQSRGQTTHLYRLLTNSHSAK